MRALRKRQACAEGLCEPSSSACARASIARVPIPKSSIFFFLWHQRKKKMDTTGQNQTLTGLETMAIPCFES